MQSISLRLLFYFLTLFLVTSLKGQNSTFQWAHKQDGFTHDYDKIVSTDSIGNLLRVGTFYGTVDFDPGVGIENIISNGSTDMFVQKIDTNGNLLWVKHMGGSGHEKCYALNTDDFDNIYTTGSFSDTVDFDPGIGVEELISGGGTDIFVQKLDANGNFEWVKQFTGSGNSRGYSVATDPLGNVYVTGSFDGVFDFDPSSGINNLSSNGFQDIFLIKLNTNGDVIYVKQVGGPGDDWGSAIATDGLGNVYISGMFQDSVDFDPGVGTFQFNSTEIFNHFIQKLDANGHFQWAIQTGDILAGGGSKVPIVVDEGGNIYSTGTYNSTIDVDPGVGVYNLSCLGNFDSFVRKIDTDGNLVWASHISGSGSLVINTLTLDQDGNVYTTGGFAGQGDFDPSVGTYILNASNQNNAFIQKLDNQGELIWVKQFSGASNCTVNGLGITADTNGVIYNVGIFTGTVDFDPGSNMETFTSNGLQGYYLKLKPCLPISTIDEITTCESYTWIDGVTYYQSNDSVTYNIVGGAANGCDSIVELKLTIKNVSDNTILFNGLTMLADNDSATYVWLDCDNDYSIIQGETSQLYVPTQDGNYAVQLSENGCVDTSACISVSTFSLNETTFANGVTLYPNPNKGIFTLELSESQAYVEVKVLTVLGQELKKEIFVNTDLIPLEIKEPEGVYMIQLTNQNGEKTLLRVSKQ